MPRPPKLWRRAQNGHWYSTINGKQVDFGPDFRAAELAFHRRLGGIIDDGGWTVRDVGDNHAAYLQRERSPRTAQDAITAWRMLVAELGADRPAASLRPADLTSWMLRRGWSASYRHRLLAIYASGYAHAEREGNLPANPLAGMRKPMAARRVLTLTRDEIGRLIRAAPPTLRAFIIVAAETGARPDELRRLEVRHVQPGGLIAVLPRTEAKGRKRPRAIAFPLRSRRLISWFVRHRRPGPLLLNADGRPWRADSLVHAFARLRESTGIAVTPYALRHSFATNGLAAGIDAATLAALMGHESLAMIVQNYAHLNQRPEWLAENAAKLGIK